MCSLRYPLEACETCTPGCTQRTLVLARAAQRRTSGRYTRCSGGDPAEGENAARGRPAPRGCACCGI